ncbi:hypothetical protein B6259_07790 [Ruminococcaceae bacterium CPB6]|jgi:chromosome segregation ATPase|nr:hypothetical protein B6259_07790 [Ruminococcaceae bacterium CPB6]
MFPPDSKKIRFPAQEPKKCAYSFLLTEFSEKNWYSFISPTGKTKERRPYFMPRRKKEENMTYEERIQDIDRRIAQCKETVSQLRSQRRQLEKERDEEAMQRIYAYIRSSDMSPAQFLDLLQEQDTQDTAGEEKTETSLNP